MTPPTPPTTRSSSRSSGCEPGAAFPPCLFSLFFPFPFTPFLAQTPTQPNPKPPNPVRVLAVSASCGRGLPFLPRFSPPANPANPPNLLCLLARGRQAATAARTVGARVHPIKTLCGSCASAFGIALFPQEAFADSWIIDFLIPSSSLPPTAAKKSAPESLRCQPAPCCLPPFPYPAIATETPSRPLRCCHAAATRPARRRAQAPRPEDWEGSGGSGTVGGLGFRPPPGIGGLAAVGSRCRVGSRHGALGNRLVVARRAGTGFWALDSSLRYWAAV